MLKKTIISFLSVFFFMTAAGSRGEAFVPQTPHLLHLMVRQIKEPAGLVVRQSRRVPSPEGSPDAETPKKPLSAEVLSYLFPGKLRVEAGGEHHRYYVVSDDAVVRVEDGRVTGTALPLYDRYTDVLLYRDHERLPLKMAEAGVNVEKVTFQRLDGRICYFIGNPPVDKVVNPGLWIDKESFFPVRYLMQRGPWRVDVRYGDWEKVSRTWYPKSVKILVNDREFADITVDSVEIGTGFSPGYFDAERILGALPRAEDASQGGTGHQDRVQALDRELEEFNKLYD